MCTVRSAAAAVVVMLVRWRDDERWTEVVGEKLTLSLAAPISGTPW